MPLAVLVGLIAGPVVLLFMLRVNAALVFLSLCLGSVLVQFVGSDAVSVASGASNTATVTDSSVKLGLLLAPVVLTVIFMIGTVHGKQKFVNVLPAAGAGLLTALLVVPLLPNDLSNNIQTLNIWSSTKVLQSAVVTGATIVCLLFLWASRPKKPEEGKKHKH